MEDFPSKYLCFLLDPWSILAKKKNKEYNTVTYQESPPWLPTMFKTPCVETIVPRVLTVKQASKYPAESWTLKIIGYY